MLSQVDSEGYSTTMMEAIIDYRKDDAAAVSMADKYLTTRSGQAGTS